ncbi:hypothetical protein FIBSPDRAFT_855658 [Athelia psychrophila]|uniref:Uncharacterized protein n=1 Tax=Athelia psychrophila TaxID=1759441 RepID=A0A166P675_9AGAM|nr:hypothetical protein FIBSPDRAFT_867814 [Fibularhizoctonia sp. CBS 109695]KZP25754.1 hypothetical protein FIBSPDRAFT_855658 [Fibularhizoctonia sp. CBS 109695]
MRIAAAKCYKHLWKWMCFKFKGFEFVDRRWVPERSTSSLAGPAMHRSGERLGREI